MDKDRQNMLFTQLVVMFHMAAMQQMGKLKNPITDKVERDLAAAQTSIDMLDMLKDKAKGNMIPEEERFLNDALRELKLNYVDEMNKDAGSTPEQQQEKKDT